MLEESKNELEKKLAEEAFFNELNEDISGFKLTKIFSESDSAYDLFKYENEDKHCGLKTYYHSDTKEYRIVKRFGLNEFCLTELITEDLSKFIELLKDKLFNIIMAIDLFEGDENFLVNQKGISDWKYASKLQEQLEGFELYLSPKKYLEVTNGSFVIINYCDFKINSDLAIYYNIFSNNFGSEARINGSPTVIYDFDSDTLQELETKLKANLNSQLKNIRESL